MSEPLQPHDNPSSDVWQPTIYDPSTVADRNRLTELRAQGRVWQVKDTLRTQLTDLAKTRSPGLQSRPGDLAAQLSVLTNNIPPERYGRWVFYPWSGLLVHLLPPEQFRELRLDRNRYKLTEQDQEHLSSVTIGIAGLSAGNSIAITLAMEGIVGHLRLADMDSLDLSNMNRLRAGLHEIGTKKTVLAARQISEFDPYLDMSLFHEGVTALNVDSFFDGGPAIGPSLDYLIEECDSLHMKFLLREHAKTRRVPVLMHTSDRGMLDVERFDQEPARPSFHGLIDGVGAAENLTRDQEIEIATRLVNADLMSTGAAASLLEIDSSLSTWPQLASDVGLGAASVATAIRLLALGTQLPSGRCYVDLEHTIKGTTDDHLRPERSSSPAQRPQRKRQQNPRTGSVPELARHLVSYAIQAPSGGNSQPWHFYWGDDLLWVTHDRQRPANLLDPHHHGAYLALGAAVENIAIAAASHQLDTSIQLFPIPAKPDVIATISTSTGSEDNTATRAGLARQLKLVSQRRTRRALIPSSPLCPDEQDALVTAAATRRSRVDLCLDPLGMKELGLVMGAADRLRFLAANTHREFVAELRFTRDEAEKTKDGLALDTLGLSPAGQVAIQLLARADVAALLRRIGGGARCEQLAADAVASSSALGLLSACGDTPADWVACGRGMQQLWLEAELLGIALHPMTTPVYLFETIPTPSGPGFTEDEVQTLRTLRDRFYTVFPPATGPAALLFRLGRITDCPERSLRRPPESVLTAGTPPNATATT